MWLRDASLEGKLPTIEQMTLDPYEYFPYRFGHALWSYIGERWGDEAVGAILKATLSRRGRAGVPADDRPQPRAAVRPVARRGAEALPARDRRPGQGAGGGRRAAHREALPGYAAPGTGALARRVAGGVLQREGLLLRRPLSGRRRKPARSSAGILKSGISSNYETYRFINSPGQLVARRQVPRVRRQAGRAGRDRRSWTSSATSEVEPDQAQAERGHDARPGARTDSSSCSPATTAASATCSR